MKGSPNELYRLAEGYYYGETVAQSYENAVKWYLEASDRGCVEAKTALGICAKKGHGMEIDLEVNAPILGHSMMKPIRNRPGGAETAP